MRFSVLFLVYSSAVSIVSVTCCYFSDGVLGHNSEDGRRGMLGGARGNMSQEDMTTTQIYHYHI